jgi:GAF domain-containing protein
MSRDAGQHNGSEPADKLLEFARGFATDWSERPMNAKELVDFATTAVPHAIGVGLTLVKGDGQPMTLAASSELAEIVDRIEYDCGEGPCLDAIEHDDVTVSNDLANDERWPKFAERAVAETPVRSMFGARIFLSGKERGALNFYSDKVDAFDQLDLGIGAMLSVIASIALQHAEEQRRRENLEIALESSRVIGMAMGIVMSSRLVTADQAFEALRKASQDSNRKLRDVAVDVTETGLLPERQRRPELDL